MSLQYKQTGLGVRGDCAYGHWLGIRWRVGVNLGVQKPREAGGGAASAQPACCTPGSLETWGSLSCSTSSGLGKLKRFSISCNQKILINLHLLLEHAQKHTVIISVLPGDMDV